MSRVHLIAADKPLPLCDQQEERTSTHMVSGKSFTISFVRGFRVSEHHYYRCAVDRLGYSMKSWQYELEAEVHETDLSHLKSYLRENFRSGEVAELWSLWVGNDRSDSFPHYSCRLEDLDLGILERFLNPGLKGGVPDQCRLTITI